MKYISFIVLFFLIFLGTWQVYRLQYKKVIEHKIQKEAITLPIVINQSSEYTRVKLQCNIIDKKNYMYAGVKGYYLFVPCQTNDNRVILTNLGIVSNQENLHLIEQLVEITGFILFKVKKPLFIDTYNEKSNTWFSIDSAAVAEKLHINLEPYVIWAEKTELPYIEDNGCFKIYNHHLEYVVTWYSLALCLICYMLYQCVNRYKKYQIKNK